MIMLSQTSFGYGAASALLCSYFVADILLVAAVAKGLDMKGTARAVSDFNLLPTRLIRPVGFLLPLLETLFAMGLIAESLRVPAALGAAGLLCAFTFAIAVTIFRGRRIVCNCFGALGSGEVGELSLVRNGLLLASLAIVLISALFGDASGTVPLSDKLTLWVLSVPIALTFVLSMEVLGLRTAKSRAVS